MVFERWKDPGTKLENVMVELELNMAQQAEAKLGVHSHYLLNV